MRILLVIPNMTGGGAERATAHLIRHWAELHEVTLVTIDPTTPDAYPVDPRARRIYLDTPSPLASRLLGRVDRIPALRRTIKNERPDVVVSVITVTNVLTLVATRGLSVPVVVVEPSDPHQHLISAFWKRVRDGTYRWSDAIVVLNSGLSEWAESIASGRSHVIPYPVVVPRAEPVRRGTNHRVIAVGRLVPEKGFDLLLDAFAVAARDKREWTLDILGTGPERARLEQRARDLLLDERVSFVGWVPDVETHLRRADIFVLSSRQEAQGLALLEAMASGLAVAAFDCPTGPREIITPDVDGLLVPAEDVASLANAITRLIDDADLRSRLGRAAHDVERRFSLDAYLERWDELLAALPLRGR